MREKDGDTMKMIGVVLILCAGIAIGVRQAQRVKNRPRQIRAVIQVLSSVEAQVVYAQEILAEAFLRGATSASETMIQRFFRQIADELAGDRHCLVTTAFQRVREKAEPSLAIGTEEWGILEFLSENLGKCDADEMAKQIALATEHLKVREQITRREAEQKEKLWIYLGICGALLIVLVCM